MPTFPRTFYTAKSHILQQIWLPSGWDSGIAPLMARISELLSQMIGNSEEYDPLSTIQVVARILDVAKL